MDNAKKGANKGPTTQIIQGSGKVVDRLVQLMQKAQRINICVENTRPLLSMEFKQIRDAFTDAKMRGVTVSRRSNGCKPRVCSELVRKRLLRTTYRP